MLAFPGDQTLVPEHAFQGTPAQQGFPIQLQHSPVDGHRFGGVREDGRGENYRH